MPFKQLTYNVVALASPPESNYFSKKNWSVLLKSVFFQREILLKSVDFDTEKHLKSVDRPWRTSLNTSSDDVMRTGIAVDSIPVI